MWGKRWGIGRRNFVSVLVGLIPAVLLHHFLVDFPYQVLGLPVFEQNSCWGMALSCGSVWRKTKLTVPPGSVGDGGTVLAPCCMCSARASPISVSILPSFTATPVHSWRETRVASWLLLWDRLLLGWDWAAHGPNGEKLSQGFRGREVRTAQLPALC